MRCAFCVFRSHSFVSLARFALPYPRIFLAVVHGIDEGIRLSGSAVWLSTSAYSHFDAVSSQRTAGAVRLVRGRDALTISDIGMISFVTCFSAERSAFPLSAMPLRWAQGLYAERRAFTLSHTLRATCGTLLFRLVWALTYTLLSMRTNAVLTPC